MVISVTNYEIKNMINDYIQNLDVEAEHFSYSCDFLLFAANIYHLVEASQADINIKIESCLNRLKKSIEQGEYNGSLALYEGLTEIAVSVYAINTKLGICSNFLTQVNQLLLSKLNGYLSYLHVKETQVFDYDIIYGVSGILNYLLECHKYNIGNLNYSEYIDSLVTYLITLGEKSVEINGELLEKWVIKPDSIIFAEDKNEFPKGYVDLGYAHGLSGILYVLAKSYERGFIHRNQKKVMDKIVSECTNNLYTVNNEVYFKTSISLDNETFFEENILREGWCYGVISLYNSILKFSKATEDIDLETKMIEEITKKLHCVQGSTLLSSPSLCHGNSSILFWLAHYANEFTHTNLSEEIVYHQNKILNYIQSGYSCMEPYLFLEGDVGVTLTYLFSTNEIDDFFRLKLGL